MTRFLKSLLCVGLLMAGGRAASGFVLLGPTNEVWQVPTIGFDLPGDVGAPKNISQEYRRNVPVLFYTFDTAFEGYFGADGIAAVEKAFAMMNSLPEVSSITNLMDYPLDTRAMNLQANYLGLMDMKSRTLSVLVEQLGLGQPERFTWCLHNRFIGPGGCPDDMDYIVVQRNFAIEPSSLDTLQYSPYVNNSMLTYWIDEDCNVAPFGLDPAADAEELNVDEINAPLTAVASARVNLFDLGSLYTGLTRDDMAGLRYLMRFPNINRESLGTNSMVLSTNLSRNALSILVTSNLQDLATIALTNDTPGLQAAFPNLMILNTTPYLAQVVTTNYSAYFTNFPWTPAGTPATLAYATNYDTNVVFNYRHTLGNVVSNTFIFPNGYRFTNQSIFAISPLVTSNLVTVIETNVTLSSSPWSPPGAGVLTTNVTATPMWTNMVVGDFFLPPTNLCGAFLLSNVLTKVTAVTNTPLAATNFVSTNGQFYSRSYVTYFTNHIFAYFPVDCLTNLTGDYHGIERVRFVRRDGYDQVLGRYLEPFITNYTVVARNITNHVNITQTVARVVYQPDFLFTAQDFVPGPAADQNTPYPRMTRGITYGPDNAAGNPGPGTIESPTFITFDSGGPVYLNFATNGYFLSQGYASELSSLRTAIWASYDETTNAPIVFPNGTSLQELENRMVIRVLPETLPDGKFNTPYSAQLTAEGGTPPYQWRLADGSPGLPSDLLLSVGGLISGRPLEPGIYDFTIRMTDGAGLYLDQAFTLTINP